MVLTLRLQDDIGHRKRHHQLTARRHVWVPQESHMDGSKRRGLQDVKALSPTNRANWIAINNLLMYIIIVLSYFLGISQEVTS